VYVVTMANPHEPMPSQKGQFYSKARHEAGLQATDAGNSMEDCTLGRDRGEQNAALPCRHWQ